MIKKAKPTTLATECSDIYPHQIDFGIVFYKDIIAERNSIADKLEPLAGRLQCCKNDQVIADVLSVIEPIIKELKQ